MACPHVAGLVAILKGKNPNASFDVIKANLQNNADRNLTSGGQTCQNIPDTQFPNYTFGFGRINAQRSAAAL
jgi:hypothetical protein